MSECQLVTTLISDESALFYLAVLAGHPVQVPQEVLGIQLVQGNLGNQAFLFLLADLGCLVLEDQGLPSLHLTQRIL